MWGTSLPCPRPPPGALQSDPAHGTRLSHPLSGKGRSSLAVLGLVGTKQHFVSWGEKPGVAEKTQGLLKPRAMTSTHEGMCPRLSWTWVSDARVTGLESGPGVNGEAGGSAGTWLPCRRSGWCLHPCRDEGRRGGSCRGDGPGSVRDFMESGVFHLSNTMFSFNKTRFRKKKDDRLRSLRA